MLIETETELPKTEPSMEQKSDHEDQSSSEQDVPYTVSEVSSDNSNHSCSVEMFYDDELDFLEVQRINNIMKAAYKEFMDIAVKARAWVVHPPALGSVEDLQEMFHTPPPHGSAVECSVECALLSISARSLISIMMDGERWASMFSSIVSSGSDDNKDVLIPLKRFWLTGLCCTEVILVNAQFRMPAEFLPRWNTRFLRFKSWIEEDTYAIIDVSTDYFEETTSDPTQKIEYKRKPSGVIIRPFGLLSEVIWIENAEVKEMDIPKDMYPAFTPNFHLTARQWISIASQNLKRRHSRLMTSDLFDESMDLPDLLTIGDMLRKLFLETVNPFPSERTWDLISDDRIRISRDMKASSLGYRDDYIATSTIYIAETPTRILTYLEINNTIVQWTSIKPQAGVKMAVAYLADDGSYCSSLRMKIESGDDEDFMGNEFFLQECTENEYCSFILSSQITEPDVYLSVIPRFCRNSLFLRPCGFAIMPAGPGGFLADASFVTICLRRELKNMEVDRAIKAMSCDMNAVIDRIYNIRFPIIIDEDIK